VKKLFYILIILLISQSAVRAQGFNWQYSSRLPFNYPYVFAGLTGNTAYSLHYAALNLSEGSGNCCQFSSGNGHAYSIGLKAEYWQTGVLAINLQLSYNSNSGIFTADGESMPFTVFDNQGKIVGHDTVSFENEMSVALNYITITPGAKRRLFGTHLFAGVAVELGYLITHSAEQKERVVSPSFYKYNDGSQVRTLGSHNIADISGFKFTPKVMLGYDLPVGIGIYISPLVSVGFPLHSISTDGSWKMWNFTFGISILRAVSYQ